ncbi:MAG: hypothetical protein Q9186_000864 [Xanthomendoza sp. 1 TL-2023]
MERALDSLMHRWDSDYKRSEGDAALLGFRHRGKQIRPRGLLVEETLTYIELDPITESYVTTDKFKQNIGSKFNPSNETVHGCLLETKSCKSSIEDYVLMLNRRKLEILKLLHPNSATENPIFDFLEKQIAVGLKWLQELRAIITMLLLSEISWGPDEILDRRRATHKRRERADEKQLLSAFAQQEREILGSCP